MSWQVGGVFQISLETQDSLSFIASLEDCELTLTKYTFNQSERWAGHWGQPGERT